MRRTPPFWALAAVLAGASACSAGAADSAAYGMRASPAAMPMAPPPPPEPDMSGAETAESYGGDQVEQRPMELAKAAPPSAPAQPGAASRPPAQQPAPAQPPAPAQGEVSAVRAPLLIYTAQIAMAVFEVNPSLAKVEALARELGGFLARRDDAAITIRVPVARFDEALRRIEGIGDMLHRNVSAQDVTEEFLDLEVRLRNARAVRDRLEKLLDKATKVEESVQLERELARVAGELERLEGRIKYLRDRAAFSTITVAFQPRPTETIGPSGPRLPVSWLDELGLARLLNL
jgi:hypothetical protein